MKTNNNIPAYRFQGYTDAWELRRFSELAEIRRGLTYSPTSIRKEGIRVLRSSNIDEDTFTFGEDDVFVDKGVVKIPLVKEGDILITAANGSSRLVGKHTIIKGLPANSTVHGGFMLLASCRNPEFVNSLMSSEWYNKFINLYVAGGNGAIGNLNKNDLDNQLVVVPSTSEQSAIGTFFSILDQQITLHQRKFDTLKEQKKTYLKLLFPAKGQTKPALRFQGIEDDWEEVKLGKILKERNEQIAENEEYPLMSFVQGVGVTPKGERYDRSFLVKEDNKKYKKTELGDFIYSSNNLETGSIGFNKTGKAVISPVYSIFYSKDEFESSFIGILSQRKDFIAKMIKFRQGVVYGQWRIHENDFLQILLRIPTKAEMEKIIIFFQTLDQEIAQVEDKLASLKEMKKTLLRKLFV
ncbi:restriction endonuclease subunit S [Streptococcus suis]|nr:restriction endonuclease subunit S [Streptococcus suis]